MSFFGGWCGSVPLSFIIWYILHHRNPPLPPGPEPWRRISIVAALSGVVFATVVNAFISDAAVITASTMFTTAIAGVIGGTVGGGVVANGALQQIK